MSGLEAVGNMFMGPKTNEEARRRTEMYNQSEADVLQFGGCRDDQTSADARINGQASGAMVRLISFVHPSTPFLHSFNCL